MGKQESDPAKLRTGVMRDATAPPAARVSAATALLDRGHGKPTQPISGDDEMPPMAVSIEERRAKARAIIDAAFGEVGNNQGRCAMSAAAPSHC